MPKTFDDSVRRWLRARNYRATAAGSSEQNGDRGSRAALTASLLAIASGLMVAVVVAIVRPSYSLMPFVADVGLVVVVGGVIPFLPWKTFPFWLKSTLGPLGLVLLGVAGVAAPHMIAYLGILYVVDFVFMGLFEPPGFQLLVAPLGLAAAAAPLLFTTEDLNAILPSLAAVAMGAITAEVVAWMSATEKTRSERLMAIVAMARNLAATDSFIEGIDKAMEGLLSLVNADYAILVLWDHGKDRPGELFTRGRGGSVGNGAMIAIARRALVTFHSASLDSPLPKAKVVSVVEPLPFYTSWRSEPLSLIAPPSSVVYPSVEQGRGRKYALQVPLFGAEHLLGVLLVEANGENELQTKSQLTVLSATSADLSALLQRQLRTERLASEAATDPLSGLSNRRSFFQRLQSIELGDSVAFIDLDIFKQLNDTLGHHEGDIEISRFSVVLASNQRNGDLAARYGGDEFALVFRGANEDQVMTILERIRRSWATIGRTTFSAGVAQYRANERPIDLLRRADLAVYAAKRRGRNRTVTSQAMTKAEQSATTTEGRIDRFQETGESVDRISEM